MKKTLSYILNIITLFKYCFILFSHLLFEKSMKYSNSAWIYFKLIKNTRGNINQFLLYTY